ncbi:MAG: MaoC/PaaZ C-terminal domain-containing protein [Archaeoglobaceae archaeon]|uniref:Dehydratase n=1 Tax=Archaeoglobus fulgidus TaxID=2234 RepID=A0A7J3M0W0_ARCFL
MEGLYFEEFEIGKEFETAGRTITEADIVNFAGITGDWNQLHTDSEFAKNTIFGQRIAHGTLVFSIMTGLLVRLGFIEKTILAFYGIDKLRFTNPVFIGDTIKAIAKVVEKEDKGAYGLVTIESRVVKQSGDVVLKCILKVAVKKRG